MPTSYDACCDITLRLAPIVMEAGNVLPVMTRVSLHASDVYDIHSLASQAVTPSPALCDQPFEFKKTLPVKVIHELESKGMLE